MTPHDRFVEETARGKRTVLLFGGLGTGKTSLARALLAEALRVGRAGAYLDAELGRKIVGPPTTVTARFVRAPSDLDPGSLVAEDLLWFVGSTSPEDHALSLVTAIANVERRIREAGIPFVVIDTGAMVPGISGQLLAYHEVEAVGADVVVGLQRGEELLPLLGAIQRLFAIEVVPLPILPGTVDTSAEDRVQEREASMRRYFSAPLHRFRVKPTVFLPTLPPLLDLAELDRLVVGLADGVGGYTGIGYLEHAPGEDLRLVTPVAAGPKALRLGSVRLDGSYQARRVDLRNLFGSE